MGDNVTRIILNYAKAEGVHLVDGLEIDVAYVMGRLAKKHMIGRSQQYRWCVQSRHRHKTT